MLDINKTFSRPLSPHLTIYSSQFTSIFSIWHRITGISIVIFLLNILIVLKIYSYNIFSLFFEFHLISTIWFKNSIFLNLAIFLSYHVINGIRHIIWDLGYTLPINKIKISVKVLIIIIFFIISIITYKIIN